MTADLDARLLATYGADNFLALSLSSLASWILTVFFRTYVGKHYVVCCSILMLCEHALLIEVIKLLKLLSYCVLFNY